MPCLLIVSQSLVSQVMRLHCRMEILNCVHLKFLKIMFLILSLLLIIGTFRSDFVFYSQTLEFLWLAQWFETCILVCRALFPHRRKRAVNEQELSTVLTTTPQLTTTDALNSTTAPTNKSTTADPGVEPEQEDTARSEIVVLANTTSVPIFDLDPFVEYSIEVLLPHAVL